MQITEDQRQKQLKRYKKLSDEWRQNQLAAKTPELYQSILKCAMNVVQLDIAKTLDPDLASLKEQVKTAMEPYTEGKKENNLQIEFLVDALRSRGENVPDPEDFLRKVAKETPAPIVNQAMTRLVNEIGNAVKHENGVVTHTVAIEE